MGLGGGAGGGSGWGRGDVVEEVEVFEEKADDFGFVVGEGDVAVYAVLEMRLMRWIAS